MPARCWTSRPTSGGKSAHQTMLQQLMRRPTGNGQRAIGDRLVIGNWWLLTGNWRIGRLQTWHVAAAAAFKWSRRNADFTATHAACLAKNSCLDKSNHSTGFLPEYIDHFGKTLSSLCCCCCCFTTSSWENYSTWCRLSTIVGFAWSFLMNCNWICNKSHKRRQKRLAGKRQNNNNNNNNWLETVASSVPARQTDRARPGSVCVCEWDAVKCERICMQIQD